MLLTLGDQMKLQTFRVYTVLLGAEFMSPPKGLHFQFSRGIIVSQKSVKCAHSAMKF